MTYFREKPFGIISETIDFQEPTDLFKEAQNVDVPEVKTIKYKVEVPTGGITVDLGMFTTITSVVVQNLDVSNYVTFTATNDSASAAVAQRISPYEFVKLCDVKVASDFTLAANTSSCMCIVVVAGT